MKLGGSSLLSISRKHGRISIYNKHPGFTPTSLKLTTLLKLRSTGRRVKLALPAFTIVELLVVIVVIGILAAITVVSYSGISQKASLASLQSDLANAANKLKAYQVIYGSYPTLDANNCPSAPAVDVNYCLKFSSSTVIATAPFAGYVVNNTTTPKTFSLTLTNNDRQGVVTESSKPSILTPAPLDPVADWIATPQGDHYGNYYDPVSKSWATVTRSTPKTIYDPATQHIYDVPANYLAINPWSAYQPGGNGSAAVIEEARTNYLANSSLEVDSDGNGMADGIGGPWGPGISSFSKQLIGEGGAPHGNKYQRFNNITASSPTVFQIYTGQIAGFSASESASCSAYVSGDSKGVSFMIRTRAYQDNTTLGEVGPTVALTNTFTKVEANYNSLPLNTNKVMCLYQFNGVDPGDSPTLNLEAIQLEKGIFSTSYIPTTTTTVTRNPDKVSVSSSRLNASAGTFMAIHGIPSNKINASLAQWSGVLNPSLRIAGGTFGDTKVSQNATNYAVGVATASGWQVATSTWDSSSGVIGAYHNTTGGYYNGSAFTPSPGPNVFIGQYGSDVFIFNGSIQRLIIYPTALSSVDIANVIANTKDGPK